MRMICFVVTSCLLFGSAQFCQAQTGSITNVKLKVDNVVKRNYVGGNKLKATWTDSGTGHATEMTLFACHWEIRSSDDVIVVNDTIQTPVEDGDSFNENRATSEVTVPTTNTPNWVRLHLNAHYFALTPGNVWYYDWYLYWHKNGATPPADNDNILNPPSGGVG